MLVSIQLSCMLHASFFHSFSPPSPRHNEKKSAAGVRYHSTTLDIDRPLQSMPSVILSLVLSKAMMICTKPSPFIYLPSCMLFDVSQLCEQIHHRIVLGQYCNLQYRFLYLAAVHTAFFVPPFCNTPMIGKSSMTN